MYYTGYKTSIKIGQRGPQLFVMVQMTDIHLMENNPWLNLLESVLPAQEIDSDPISFRKKH